MSMTLMVQAMNIRVGHPIRKLVLLKLADNANDKGECWPSYQHIADHCECSKSAVRSHIDALIKLGLLLKINRIGINNGKGNTSNIYSLKLDTPVAPESTGVEAKINNPPMSPQGTGMPHGDSPMSPQGTPPMSPHGTRISHSFEPVIEPVKEPKECQADELPDDFDDPALRVLNHLNKTTGAAFQDGKTTMGFINGLLVDEYVADELILVIDHRADLWSDDMKMSQHLCPKTLFSFENFEGYLPLARKWDAEGRPSSRAPVIDCNERDTAYKRFLGQAANLIMKSPLELCVRKLASNASVGGLSPEASKRTWDRLWAEQAARMQKNELTA
ncbi:conserved phage C-terminal domain-containing protein [Buttiauxella gaviniae]|uniref:conserved phage C-terminal domain-containing protein n=1 Tax=Buttiauxella gaviniae TaxID=82990 RepID=UPI00397709BC